MESTLRIELDYDLLADKMAERVIGKITRPNLEATSDRKKIFGIRGLAGHIGCSVSKAQALKNQSAVPYYTYGNRIFFYSDEIDEALKSKIK